MKTKDFATKKFFDFRGLKCPLPVLKTKRALKEVKEGEIIEVLADDPAADIDFKHFCEVSGNILIKITQENNIIKCLIQKNTN